MVSLAQPSTEVRVPRERATVIMAVDVSLSMEARDVEPNRLPGDAEGGQGVRRRPARAGSTSGWSPSPAPPRRWCHRPPTASRCAARCRRPGARAESTAIGEAIFTSLTAIQNFQATLEDAGEEAPPARVVLLSDGYPTVGRDETQAIAAAQDVSIPVSTIAFGTDYGTLDLDGDTVPVPVDRATLEQIADETGGSYSEAASAEELEEVYADLGSQIGYTTEPQDISPRFVRVGVLVLLRRRRPQPALDQPPGVERGRPGSQRRGRAARSGARCTGPATSGRGRSWRCRRMATSATSSSGWPSTEPLDEPVAQLVAAGGRRARPRRSRSRSMPVVEDRVRGARSARRCRAGRWCRGPG